MKLLKKDTRVHKLILSELFKKVLKYIREKSIKNMKVSSKNAIESQNEVKSKIKNLAQKSAPCKYLF